MDKQKKNRSSKPSPKPDNTYARISGITFELLALNLGIIAGGYYLNDWLISGIPWILVTSIFLSMIATIYYLLKKFGS